MHVSELVTRRTERVAIDSLVKHRTLVRVAHGYYAWTKRWNDMTRTQRHAALARAVALRNPRLCFNHATAAILHGLPWSGRPPRRLQTLVEGAKKAYSTGLIQTRNVPSDGRSVLVDGVRVTSMAQTLLDVACDRPLWIGLACADAAFRKLPATDDALRDLVQRNPRRKGIVTARKVVELADPRSESGGESICRAMIHLLGFAAPSLQQVFMDGDGFIGRGDFYWEDVRVLLEFDGMAKYADARMLAGKAPHDVFVEERRREHRIRSLGIRVIRATWADLRDLKRLARLLDEAGVPRRTPVRPMKVPFGV
ncbi:hypothetical protein FB461_2112 [Rarobacter faecitabidus]|uniref:Uncharacterized protein n=2 Tax=Rarobacter faecitabidus TaxID=13243 RepID=A0A542ZAK9_RARFA|nr:hypothetical protein FB461_2112 [Rarobacter faecitabidus]